MRVPQAGDLFLFPAQPSYPQTWALYVCTESCGGLYSLVSLLRAKGGNSDPLQLVHSVFDDPTDPYPFVYHHELLPSLREGRCAVLPASFALYVNT